MAWLEAIIVIAVLALGFAQWRLSQKLLKLSAEQELKYSHLSKMLETVSKGSVGVGHHLSDVEAQLKAVADNRASSGSDYMPYDHAIKLLAQGGSSTELVEQCHLSRAEADLLALIHLKTSESISST